MSFIQRAREAAEAAAESARAKATEAAGVASRTASDPATQEKLGQQARAAMGAARKTEKDTTMATIGTFTSNGNGFTGTVRTLALNAKAKLVRVETPSDKGPHFRIFAGNVELGAAWQKTAKDTERDYLSVKLDDPSFPAPIYATLIEVEGQEGLQLIWSRPNRD